jgi:hypothetical protein
MKSFLNTTIFPNKTTFQTKQSDSILSELITLFQVPFHRQSSIFSQNIPVLQRCKRSFGYSVYVSKRLATKPVNTVNIPSMENKKRSRQIITDLIFLFVIFLSRFISLFTPK